MKPGLKEKVLKYWGAGIFNFYYMLNIIDDIVVTIKSINESLKVKYYKLDCPDIYFGVQLTHMDNSSVEELGHISKDNYFHSMVSNGGLLMDKHWFRLTFKFVKLLNSSYFPGMDFTD